MKQVSYWDPTNFGRQRTNFSRDGDVACGICAPLGYGIVNNELELIL